MTVPAKVQITITEALAEIVTLNKRLVSKRQGILDYLVRDEKLKDPIKDAGGSVEYVKRERQSIADLEKRVVAIRTAIQQANLATPLTLEGRTMSIFEWLSWRREVAANAQTFLSAMSTKIVQERARINYKGNRSSIGVSAIASVDTGSEAAQAVVNVDEGELRKEQDALETLLGTLDGKLSLFNATQKIELAA